MHSIVILYLLSVFSMTLVGGCSTEKPDINVPEKQGVGVLETRLDGAIRLTNCRNEESCQNPAFSPDGEDLIFTKFLNGYNTGPSEIIRMRLSDLKEYTIISSKAFLNITVPGSSWKERLITYASDDSKSGNDEIFIINKFGNSKEQITLHDDESGYLEPTFSKDGSKIVFEKDICPINNCNDNDLDQGTIWVVNIDGTHLEQLIGDSSADYRLPNWAPTGNKILFQKRNYPLDQNDEPFWDIWTMDEDGPNLKNVTASSSYDTDASWSWDGKSIVYSSDFSALQSPNIFMIHSSGGTPVRMTHSTTKEDGAPSFSPDGRHIAFESHKTSDEDSPTNIWLITVSP